ncbi:WXG100 family type VII secretion target [Agreia sp. PsM10]|jgi:early secretory antigenic target protein ESAT-6|uniref:WXG100 family type VII secretion target n=1 Tax=Agreia sp. PsM10 TaxID=3030533 RepID=UPI00263AA033|nr:WXG100 family type VII secretion target [Agreia sp. PsM10]MDN4641678.1 WXG100 family type VII secretion target [Agreia sp. PsM10]
MSQYQVDSEAVSASASSIRSTIDRIQADVAAMHGQLTSLEGSWTGQAAVAFQAVVADWRGTQTRVEESLASITQALSAAAQTYADVEMQNVRMFAV